MAQPATPGVLGRGILGIVTLGGPRPVVSRPVTPFPVDLVAHLGAVLGGVVVYPSRLPEAGATFPAITFAKVHAGRTLRLAGSSGVVADRYQFDCWSPDALAAATAAEQLRAALQNFRGAMGGSLVLACNLVAEMQMYEPPVDASAVGRFRIMLEFAITRSEGIDRPAP